VFTGQTPSGGLTFTDTPPGVSQPYTYCVTALDAAGNQSAVFPQSAQPNCGACIPGLQAMPPRNADARLDGVGRVAVWWDRSLDDDALSGAGYQIFRCEDQTCSSPVEISGAGCGDLAADGGIVSALSAEAPVVLNSEPAGVHTYGVAYRSDCSNPATQSTVSVTSALSVGADCQGQCIHVSNCPDYNDLTYNCSAINRIDTSHKGTDGAYLRIPAPGLEVFLADASGRTVGPSALTDSNGAFHIVIDNNSGLVDVVANYMVLLRIPAAEKSGVPCDTSLNDSQGNGHVVLARNLKVVADDTRTNRAYGADLPMDGGGRAEVGNPNCDNSVNITDMVLLRKGFGAAEGDSNYRSYLDFNGNGVIDVSDFMIMKKYFGMELDTAPTHDASLCAP
jgi:hypothetical protein